jgi:cytosine/adenosine deaminase-related metal-dependent hydrolase
MQKTILSSLLILLVMATSAQIQKAPEKKEGEGPWSQLILRGAVLVNGTGAPPVGPVDIVIEQNRITAIRNVGYPGIPVKQSSRPVLKDGGKEIDCSGMYILPGFIDMHGHIEEHRKAHRQNMSTSFGWHTA